MIPQATSAPDGPPPCRPGHPLAIHWILAEVAKVSDDQAEHAEIEAALKKGKDD
jgi:hypothetical protein